MDLSISKLELDVLNDFFVEAMEHLDGIEEKILQLETSMDRDLVNSIFRPAHTIKGSAAFLGLNDIKFLAHEMETLLDELRKNKISVSSELIDTLLAGVDILGQMLTTTKGCLEDSDTGSDPVVFSLPDIDIKETVEAIQNLKNFEAGNSTADKPFDQKKGEAEEVVQLLTSEELKAIQYPPGMKEQFVEEGIEHIENLENGFVEIEGIKDKGPLYDNLFRSVHTLKGNAGVILSMIPDEKIRQRHPLKPFQEITHVAESLMQNYRDKPDFELESSTVDLFLATVDGLKKILESFKEDSELTAEYNFIISQLVKQCEIEKKVDTKPENIKDSDGNGDDTVDEALLFAFNNSFSQCCEAIDGGLQDITDDSKRKTAIDKMIRALKTLVRLGENLGLDDLVSSSQDALNIVDFIAGEKDENEQLFLDEIDAKFLVIKEIGDEISRIKPVEDSGVTSEKVFDSPYNEQEIQHAKKTLANNALTSHTQQLSGAVIKVSQDKLDKLMNLVGELIVSKNNFLPLARELSVDYDMPDAGKKIKAAGDLVSRISDELQATVMSIRMLPVSTVFTKFPRMIRDLSKKMSKDIKLVISGEETELDKTIIESLGDPLVHLVRNSADHGIEPPEERISKGKSTHGTIHLNAYNQGHNVVIDIIDDGRGLDPNALRAKAVERGMLNLENLEKMDDQAILNLIFAPGFSTAKEVTEVSGRGVGMDVVRTNIEKIGGTVLLSSVLGVGTTVSIRLPLTLAVSKGLEVSSGDERYFLPLDYVMETVRVPEVMVHSHRGQRMVVVRDDLLPIKKLSSLLDIDSVRKSYNRRENGEISLVILNINGRKLALEVDQFYNESEFVIKSIEGVLACIDGLSGATVTGEGTVILVLDPVSLL